MHGVIALQVEALRKSFRRKVPHRWRSRYRTIDVLDKLSFVLPMFRIAAILGPSGCGKSTLLRILAGLETSDGGHVAIPQELRTGIVFQADNCLPWLTVAQNVGFGIRGSDSRRRETISRALEVVELSDRAESWTTELSGGQRQRVAFARLIAANQTLWLLDEPFSALDARSRKIMQRVVRDGVRARRRSVVLVTHDIDEALSLADVIILLSRPPARVALTVRNLREIRADLSAYTVCMQFLRDCLGDTTPRDAPALIARHVAFEKDANAA
ncbi:MAG TPA: ATP-binding cassette domain-containing protein [Thermoanaerobaculia bacterium]|nr:ATP-binding cassette domain-containing protein [Thermoanaerobaculia bacterium]